MKLKVALGQIRPVTGDIDGNVKQIIKAIEKSKSDGSDVLIFPELSITGYCCGALFENNGFIGENLNSLFDICEYVSNDLVIIVGYADFGYDESCLGLLNAVSVIQNGEIKSTYYKEFLANDGHHEDKKYFISGKDINNHGSYVAKVKKRGEDKFYNIGTLICQDIWEVNNQDLLAKATHNADLLAVCNHSYFTYEKKKERLKLVQDIAENWDVPIAYVNPVGVGDIVKNVMIYDGGSFIVDKEGQLYADSFCDDFEPSYKQVYMNGCHAVVKELRDDKYSLIFRALNFTLREFYKLSGIKKAQVHISGGLDSAVVACLAAYAMGPENCVFISNPTEFNGDETRGFAQHISDQLGVDLIWNPTGKIYERVVKEHKKSFGEEPTPTGKASIQAVSRTVQGLAASHTFGSGIIACGNHTEIVLGWASFHDIGSIGVLSLIGDLTKVEVFEFAEWINKKNEEEIIPASLYNGDSMPAAELPDSSEDPFDYFVVSGICAELIRNKANKYELIEDFSNKELSEEFFPIDWTNGKSIYDKLNVKQFTEILEECICRSRKSVFKAAQSAPVPIISKISRGFSSRETLINKYKK